MDTLTMVLFVVGLILLVGGAEVLVRGAARLATAAGVSPLVVGLTVVAFGTSSPELAVSIQAALADQADIALGNIIGSNICNVLLILGLSAAIVPLAVDQKLVRFEVPLMIGVSLLPAGMVWDGKLARWEGVMLFAGMIAYTFWSIYSSRRETRAVKAEYAEEFDYADSDSRQSGLLSLGLVALGLAALTLGSRWLVDGAVAFATALGVSHLVIGLTIVAVGTSLPELATSVIASLRGQRDIAVGNVVGSNLFNILSVLGLAAALAPNGVAVSQTARAFDIPVMIAVAAACLPIFFAGHRIDRWNGVLFLGYYGAYLLYQILASNQHPALSLFNTAMLVFVIPITAVALGISVIRSIRNGTPVSP